MSDDYGYRSDRQDDGSSDDGSSMANVVYILYLLSLVTGITGLIGLILAYVSKEESSPWVQTHYQFQIRTFWIGFLISIVGLLTFFLLIGWLIWLFGVVWLVVRCAKGMSYLGRGEALPNPETWMWE